MTRFRLTLGITIWCAVAAGLWQLGNRYLVADGERPAPVVGELWRYAAERRTRTQLDFAETWPVSLGDPVFQEVAPGDFRRVGEVVALGHDAASDTARMAEVSSAEVLFYAGAPPLERITVCEYYSTPDSLAWVLETMLPPQRRAEIAALLNAAIQEHRDAIGAELRPIVQRSLQDALPILERDLRESLINNRQTLARINSRYQKDVVEKEIIPLVKREVWPVVLEEAEPVANELGLALWERVSLWRFTWRYLSDLTPLTRGDRFESEWRRFLQQEAIPELDAHTDEFIETVKQVLTETARNPRIQAALRRHVMKAIEDPELQRAVWKIVRETVFENPALREVLEDHWKSPEARAAFHIAAARLEPTAQRIGEMLFGSPEGGITPEFQAVLRNRILQKDRRWFVIRTAPNSNPRVSSNPHSNPETTQATSAPRHLTVIRGAATDSSPFLESETRP